MNKDADTVLHIVFCEDVILGLVLWFTFETIDLGSVFVLVECVPITALRAIICITWFAGIIHQTKTV